MCISTDSLVPLPFISSLMSDGLFAQPNRTGTISIDGKPSGAAKISRDLETLLYIKELLQDVKSFIVTSIVILGSYITSI